MLEAKNFPTIQAGIAGALERAKAGSDDLLGPNLLLATEIASRARALLANYLSFSKEQQKWASVGILYFIKQGDLTHDETPITGFDDDALVMNHVLEKIGLKNLYIEIS